MGIRGEELKEQNLYDRSVPAPKIGKPRRMRPRDAWPRRRSPAILDSAERRLLDASVEPPRGFQLASPATSGCAMPRPPERRRRRLHRRQPVYRRRARSGEPCRRGANARPRRIPRPDRTIPAPDNGGGAGRSASSRRACKGSCGEHSPIRFSGRGESSLAGNSASFRSVYPSGTGTRSSHSRPIRVARAVSGRYLSRV